MRFVGMLGVLVAVVIYGLSNSAYRHTVFAFMYGIPGQDRTGHFVVFFFLCVSANLGFAQLRVRGRPLGMRLVTLIVILAATLDEYSQQFVPGRESNPLDLIAGYAGIALAMLLVSPFIPEESEPAGSSAD